MKAIHFNNLLVPFDFNNCFKHSFKVAEEIALKSGATVTLLNVLNPVLACGGDYAANYSISLSGHTSIISEREQAVRDFVKQSDLPADKINVLVKVGRYNSVIIDLNNLKPFDLIIVPDFYKTALDRLLADINPLEIMEKTKTPVIAVNRSLKSFKVKRIVLPVRNVKNWFDKIPFTVAIAKLTNAKICAIGLAKSDSQKAVIKINKKISFCRQYLKMNYTNFEIEKTHINENTYQEALNFAAFKNADLIALTPPKRFFKLKSYFNAYFYTKIISRGNTPVLGLTN